MRATPYPPSLANTNADAHALANDQAGRVVRMTLPTLHVLGRTRTAASVSPNRTSDHASRLVATRVPAIVLDTCERLECYWWGDRSQVESASWSDAASMDARNSAAFLLSDDEALAHLMAVASGLRSSRFAEPEILGQVRSAWRDAQQRGVMHTELDRAMRTAIGAARHIRRQLGAVAHVSIGDAALRLIRRDLSSDLVGQRTPRNLRVLVTGAGAVGSSVASALAGSGIDGLTIAIANRSPERAARLADRVGGRHVMWSDLHGEWCAADVVISAVRSLQPIVTAHTLDGRISEREHSALWIDLATPANIAAEVSHRRVVRRTLADLRLTTDVDMTRANALLASEMERVRRLRARSLAFDGDYSCRMASMGLNRAARRAG